MLNSLDISASALTANRLRMDTVAQNLANMNTTRQADGEKTPYRRKFTLLQPQRHDGGAGVSVRQVVADPTPFRRIYEPGHPDADGEGYVEMPNVDLAVETVNMMDASRAYEANVTMMETSKAMMNATLRLIG